MANKLKTNKIKLTRYRVENVKTEEQTMATKLIDTEELKANKDTAMLKLDNIATYLNGLLLFVGDSNKGFKSGFRACNSALGHIIGVKNAIERVEKMAISFNKHKETSPQKLMQKLTADYMKGIITRVEFDKMEVEILDSIEIKPLKEDKKA